MFGKLTLEAFQHDPVNSGAVYMMIAAGIGIVAALTYFKRWSWLWKEWLTTVDHKRIAVMYFILAFVMLLRGAADAALMRGQQAVASGIPGFLPPDHYDQIFTAHGVIMIFFVAMPLMFALLNAALPLQIGARDVAFPWLNSLSLWLTVAGAMLINASLAIGEFAATGWLAYPPLSELAYSPGVGVDYYIWALQISGAGTLISAINFLVTILKMRCPGMTLMRMPIFIWTSLASMALVIAAFPILTVTLGLLGLDRLIGMHFFTSDFGGNPMMYINLIWAWGHPEVYILILPAFGIFSEVVAVFSRKRLFGYTSMVLATLTITVLSFIVWAHHFFTMGAGASVNAFFGIMTMIIAVPTGVKVFNWLFTMYRGRITFSTPMLWTVGFLITFTVGGMSGVLLSLPGADFQLHNSLFLVAHFHNTIIGGVLFGYFAGITYWFPKIMGFTLNEKLGLYAFWCWVVGSFTAFIPLYYLGLMGATRRMNYYDPSTGWQPLFLIAAAGVVIIGLGIFFQIAQLAVSIWSHKKLAATSDPWGGRTLEWSIPSPAQHYNFARIPAVHTRDAFWEMKQHHQDTRDKGAPYEDITMPKNTGIGIAIAAASFALGFGLVWHIFWLAALGAFGIIASVLARSFDYKTEYTIPAAEVKRIEARIK